MRLHSDPLPTGPSTLAATVLICALVLFSALAYGVATENPWLMRVDLQIEAWWHARVAEPWIGLMTVASAMGKPVTVIVGAGCAALVLGWRQRRFPAPWLWACVPLAVLGNQALKRVVERRRPLLDHPLQTLESYSFPSGHAVGSTVFYGLLVLWAVSATTKPRVRLLAIVTGGVVVATIAFSRVYLGVHFPSDIAAGVGEGLVWLALCALVMGRQASSDAGRSTHDGAVPANRTAAAERPIE